MRVVGDGKRSVLDLLREAGAVSPAATLCGGVGSCGRCRVSVSDASEPLSDSERALLSPGEVERGARLACALFPVGPLDVELGPELSAGATFAALDAFKPLPPFALGDLTGLGVACDIGTTTLAFALVDRGSGQVRAVTSRLNSQRAYGADVVSRLSAAEDGKLADLARLVRADIASGVADLLSRAGASPRDVTAVAIAANTAMVHLLLSLPVAGLARAPFAPETLALEVRPSADLLPVSGLDCPVSVLPGVSAYLGGDLVAGMAAYGFPSGSGPELYLDLGTNGEMAFASGGELVAASVAMGPAFEGGRVSAGSGGVPGAISSVRVVGSRFAYERIPGAAALTNASVLAGAPGLTGSALVDLLAAGLTLGLVTPDGSLARACADSGILLDPALPIRLTAADVRELQLAKAAVRAGIETLAIELGVDTSSISRVFVAGGFGSWMDVSSARAIGLLPPSPRAEVVRLGNAALAGAVRFLADPAMEGLLERTRSARPIELADRGEFARLFIDSMSFR